MIKEIYNKLFKYKEEEKYNFIIPNSSNNINEKEFEKNDLEFVQEDLSSNLEYLKIKYNMLINNDIKIRELSLNIQNIKIPAFILYIDGMVNSSDINSFLLQPIFLRNSIKMKDTSHKLTKEEKNRFIKSHLENFLYSNLIPQNSISKEYKLKEIISKVNSRILCPFYRRYFKFYLYRSKRFSNTKHQPTNNRRSC